MIERDLTAEYAAERAAALRDADTRTAEAYAALPRVKEIDGEKKMLGYNLAARLRGAADRDRVKADTLAAIARLNAEREACLAAAGFPAGYTEPRWKCARCQDTGYAGAPVKKPCACLLQRRILSRFPETDAVKRQTFDAFDLSVFPAGAQRAQMEKARAAALRYCADFPACDKRNLLLMGAPGLGKSFLLNCIAHELAGRGFPVARMTAYALIDSILSDIRDGRRPELYDWAELLIIDDLGTEPMMRNITVEYLFIILNERLAAGRSTAAATNLSVEELQDTYGERVFSRLISPEYTRIQLLSGRDVRLNRK